MNHAGEITPLVKLVRPHVAVITTVAAAHLEFFIVGGRYRGGQGRNLPRARARRHGGAQLPTTSICTSCSAMPVRPGSARIVTYGFDDSADWRISRVDATGSGTRVEVTHEGQRHFLNLQVAGRHMVANAVAALVVAQLSGEGAQHCHRGAGRVRRARGQGADAPARSDGQAAAAGRRKLQCQRRLDERGDGPLSVGDAAGRPQSAGARRYAGARAAGAVAPCRARSARCSATGATRHLSRWPGDEIARRCAG